jgi:hypothetical protein
VDGVENGLTSLQGRMERKRRTITPARAPKAAVAMVEPELEAPIEEPQSEALEAPPQPPKPPRAPAKRKQPKPEGSKTMPNGPTVNLTIRVRQNVDDLVRGCAYGLKDYGLRDVSKTELIEIAILQGLPSAATEELAAQVREFRAKSPR